ncbi:hypothetical protein V8C86DRAFT_2799239 [Haematococcus lacustris]
MTTASIAESSSEDISNAVQKLQVQEDGSDFAAPEDDADDEANASGVGGYVFDSLEHKAQLKEQRAQLWIWLKNVGSNMFRDGINLTKISLPVCLFEARSFLERITSNWEYLDLLVAAAHATDPADRMKYVVAFALSGLCRQVSFHKPFNPILGETYQSRFANGVEVFCEQISHHPPISSWQVLEPSGKFVFHGNGNWVAGIKGNHVKGRQTGDNVVTFADGSSIKYELPSVTVRGVLWGHRCIKYSGEMTFVDETNNLKVQLEVDPQPQQSYISSWFRSKKSLGYKPDQIRGSLMQGSTVLDNISGNWLHYIEWEKGVNNGKVKRVWDIKTSPLSCAEGYIDALSSDARLREDVAFLKQGDQLKAQEWKHNLEEQQRRDRRLRKEGGGVSEH